MVACQLSDGSGTPMTRAGTITLRRAIQSTTPDATALAAKNAKTPSESASRPHQLLCQRSRGAAALAEVHAHKGDETQAGNNVQGQAHPRCDHQQRKPERDNQAEVHAPSAHTVRVVPHVLDGHHPLLPPSRPAKPPSRQEQHHHVGCLRPSGITLIEPAAAAEAPSVLAIVYGMGRGETRQPPAVMRQWCEAGDSRTR